MNPKNTLPSVKRMTPESLRSSKPENVSLLQHFSVQLTKEEKQLLLTHFNTIYECQELTEHEYKMIYLALLWANGFVYRLENGFAFFDEERAGIRYDAYEISFEDGVYGVDGYGAGGMNLDLTYGYYDIDEIINLMRWNEK